VPHLLDGELVLAHQLGPLIHRQGVINKIDLITNVQSRQSIDGVANRSR
jgi:hypothetical protein